MKVSVVVIAKNVEKTLARCLSSILEQTYSAYEIVVVCGQSTDRTKEIASKFPVKVIDAPARDTYGTSRNLGIMTAKGEIVAFLDADDYADLAWLEKIVQNFHETGCGVVCPRYEYFYPHNWFTELKWNLMRSQSKETSNASHNQAWLHFRTSGVAFRKAVFKTIGLFDENMFFGSEDKDIALRIVRRGIPICISPQAIIYFKPTTSVKEWFKETFYRHGLGHGTIRRKHGKYRPPLITPAITILVPIFSLVLLIQNLWHFAILLFFVWFIAVMMKAYKIFREVRCRFLVSIKYTILETVARNIELIGFMIGFLIQSKLLRKIWRT